jgi:hypothetical protein
MAKQFKHQWHIFVDYLCIHEVTPIEFANLLIKFVHENALYFQQPDFSNHEINGFTNLKSAQEYPVELFLSTEDVNNLKIEFFNYKLKKQIDILSFITRVLKSILLVDSDSDCKKEHGDGVSFYVNKLNGRLCNVCNFCGDAFYLDGNDLTYEDYKKLTIPTIANLKNESIL